MSGGWDAPPPGLPLFTDEVHLWRVALAIQDERALQRLAETLDRREHDRAAAFHFSRDRRRFVVAHAALRAILAAHLGGEPRGLSFLPGPHGKPGLAAPASSVRFSLSHSDDLALCAVASGREVGVDIERIRRPLATSDVAERLFPSHQVAELRALPPGERAAAFFSLWTRHEAYVKARGAGLATAVGEPGQEWTLQSVAIDEGFAAAVAIEGLGCRLRRWQWPDPSMARR